jgi:YjbE family integral membrane protein|tara:strand:- start:1881 stop:2489 length:609 start_codon:yes stop_codon:yes gene_type:complete
MDLSNLINSSELVILFQIILIDLVLAADNAIIIGMVSSSFPSEIRKKVLFWGVAGAVVARVIFTLLVAYLLKIPLIKLFGGLILLWVCYRLYQDTIQNKSKEEKGSKVSKKEKTFFGAVVTILIADLSLSLDNVIGVAGAAKDHIGLLIFGLILSIILMATMANLVSKWIKSDPWLAWLGLLAILYVAIDLIYSDLNLLINL